MVIGDFCHYDEITDWVVEISRFCHIIKQAIYARSNSQNLTRKIWGFVNVLPYCDVDVVVHHFLIFHVTTVI